MFGVIALTQIGDNWLIRCFNYCKLFPIVSVVTHGRKQIVDLLVRLHCTRRNSLSYEIVRKNVSNNYRISFEVDGDGPSMQF
jgi:hypothetical protein